MCGGDLEIEVQDKYHAMHHGVMHTRSTFCKSIEAAAYRHGESPSHVISHVGESRIRL